MILFFNSFKVEPNIGKRDSFIENDFWKMTHFLENIIAETNRALSWTNVKLIKFIVLCFVFLHMFLICSVFICADVSI